MRSVVGDVCPCGSDAGYAACCGPLHHGERHAVTAEELMRSRYSAFARGDADYLFRTWHPRTRPADVTVDPDVTWTSLEVTDVLDGSADHDRGEVAFTARFVAHGRPDAMHEQSTFTRRGGRWVYVDGERPRR